MEIFHDRYEQMTTTVLTEKDKKSDAQIVVKKQKRNKNTDKKTGEKVKKEVKEKKIYYDHRTGEIITVE